MIRNGKFSEKESAAAQERAGKLIQEGCTQKEAAKYVGVSEKTMCAWAKKHGWGKQRPAKEDAPPVMDNFLADFLNTAKKQSPALYNSFVEIVVSLAEMGMQKHTENMQMTVKAAQAAAG